MTWVIGLKSRTGSIMTAILVDGSATMYCHVPVWGSKMLWIVGSFLLAAAVVVVCCWVSCVVLNERDVEKFRVEDTCFCRLWDWYSCRSSDLEGEYAQVASVSTR